MSADAPWASGPSILALLRAAGDGAGQAALPEERDLELAAAGFGSGSIDGILGHHGSSLAGLLSPKERRARRLSAARDRQAPTLFDELVRLAEHGGHDERLAVYRSLQDDGLLSSVDEVLREVRGAPWLWSDLEPHARWLVDEGRHRGPVKLGVALLGVVGDARDLERVRTLARHPDFTLYAVVAMVRLVADPVDELWDVARATTGWGRIQSVERLAPRAAGRPDVQRWLLLDGWRDAILPEYLALACATGGDLVGALSGDIDEELLEAACAILDALCNGGPGPGIERYVDGPAAVHALLAALWTRCETLEQLEVVGWIRTWLRDECTGSELEARWESRADLIFACDRILLDPQWEPRVLAVFRDGTDRGEGLGWRLGLHVGLELWAELFDRLEAEGPDWARVGRLAGGAATDEQRFQLVGWAESALPLDRIAAGERGPRGSTIVAGYQSLYCLLEPAWVPYLSPVLIVTALDSPDKTLRILAARVLLATAPQDRDPVAVERASEVFDTDERAQVHRAFAPLFR